MAQASDYQVNACKKFFSEQSRFEPLNGSFAEKLNGPLYDITKLDAHKVVALLSWIVNDQKQYKEGKAFYFLIRNDKKVEELFKLTANPTEHQPGNGLVSIFSKPETGVFIPQAPKRYPELNVALKDHYKKDTKSFASVIKKLFRNKAVVNEKDFPQITIEAYMVWLFEIARRSVTVENPTEKKKQLDDLPIGSAIARLVKLLELGSEEICTFDNVFSREGKFHCFTGEPEKRREAINEMNETLHLQELSKMFCSKEQQVGKLTEDLRNL